MKFTIGCDPEVFLVNRETGKPVSAHDLVPGSKKEPHKTTNGAIQPDGLAAEFNTNPVPLEDFRAFSDSIVKTLTDLRGVVPEAFRIEPVPTVVFDEEYYSSLPDTAKELGCDPDFCAYSEDPSEANPRPDSVTGLRSGAGHIHFGWGSGIPTDHPDHIRVCRNFIKQLDVYVGLGMTVIDGDTERRKLYGRAGAYRPKSYGVEYRTPSNAWIVDERLRRFIHSLSTAAVNNMQTVSPMYETVERFINVQEVINTGDSVAARKFLTEVLKVHIPKLDTDPAPAEKKTSKKKG